MAFRPAAFAGALALAAALLASTAAVAQTQSPMSPRRLDCSTFPPTSEAYRDCLSGRVIREPSGRRGTSPDTLGTPRTPGTTTVPNAPGVTPGAPSTAPAMPGQPGTGITGTGR
jgi:hypothetical protein